MQRKISAILAADMVGYSRLMELDEVGTLNRRNQHLAEVFVPAFKTHQGRLVKTIGDGLLAVFASVVEAVSCAVDIQRDMANREKGADTRITYRIGINLGDVIHDEGDIFGDGVNIAARLEQLAEPGGICISGSAFDHLRTTVEAGYQDMGEVRVKNISRAVRAWRVLLDPDQAGRVISGAAPEPLSNPQERFKQLEQQHGSLATALDDLKESTRDQLEAIATRFEVTNTFGMSDRLLRKEIFKRAEDFRRYRALVESIDEKSSALAGLKERAKAATEALDFDLVEDLWSEVLASEIETAAQTSELRARNAMLRGRLDQAYVLLSSTAESFAPVDPLEPARRRITYEAWFADYSNRYGGPGLEHAERLSRAAIAGLDGSDPMLLWRAHIGLGIALASQGKLASPPRDRTFLNAAVEVYQNAIKIFASKDFPVQLATTRNNLAVVLLNLARRSEGSESVRLLDQAADLLQQAIEVHTREAFPLKWAMAKDNLGNVYNFKGFVLGGTSDNGSFEKAIAAHEEALEVYERDNFPLAWAYTTGNLAMDWSDLSVQEYASDPRLCQQRAEELFLAALEVLTADAEPYQHARTLANLTKLFERRLGCADCEDREDLRRKTEEHLKMALELFRECDAEESVRLTEEALERVRG